MSSFFDNIILNKKVKHKLLEMKRMKKLFNMKKLLVK